MLTLNHFLLPLFPIGFFEFAEVRKFIHVLIINSVIYPSI